MINDKRLTQRLLNYWNNLRKDLVLPQFEQFNSGAISDIIENCCIWSIDISTNSQDKNKVYTYQFVGNSIKEAIGKDMTGHIVSSHLKKFPAARIINKVDNAIETKSPFSDEGQFINEKDKLVKYRSCLLPFGNSDGSKVSHILLGLSWNSF